MPTEKTARILPGGLYSTASQDIAQATQKRLGKLCNIVDDDVVVKQVFNRYRTYANPYHHYATRLTCFYHATCPRGLMGFAVRDYQ